ncbi:hypothetical protein RIF29_38566 [Crotalaria pallida]|uniref:Uncharacterized protein n=1 Tax=Crotalaria pallida TaxID=3830 RepID=A0AAN9E071_CROPI
MKNTKSPIFSSDIQYYNSALALALLHNAGRKYAKVGGGVWEDLKLRFGLKHGQTVHFYYVGGQRFRIEIPSWNGILYPNLPLYDDDDWYNFWSSASIETEEEEDDGKDHVATDSGERGVNP